MGTGMVADRDRLASDLFWIGNRLRRAGTGLASDWDELEPDRQGIGNRFGWIGTRTEPDWQSLVGAEQSQIMLSRDW